MKNKHLVFLLFVVFLFAGATNCIAQRTVDRHTKTTTKWTKPLQSKRPGADKYKEVTDGTRKQSEPATITEAQWQKLTQGKDYGYKNDKENDTEVPKHSAFFDFLERLFFFFASPVGTFILWTLLISLVLFVVYKIFLSGQTSLFRREKKRMPRKQLYWRKKA